MRPARAEGYVGDLHALMVEEVLPAVGWRSRRIRSARHGLACLQHPASGQAQPGCEILVGHRDQLAGDLLRPIRLAGQDGLGQPAMQRQAALECAGMVGGGGDLQL